MVPDPTGSEAADRTRRRTGKTLRKTEKRNRARRLLWESFRLLKSEMAVCRLILIPRRRLADWKRQETTRELANLLCRAGVLPREIVDSPPEC